MKKTIKWGFIGTGKIAGRFADDLKLLNDAKLIGVYGRNPENLKSFCSKYSAIPYHSLPDLLSSDVDVIYVATPHSNHREHTMLALNAGKAVLCEKPFALNTTEAEEMIELARRKSVFLMEAMWTRFFPAMKEVITIVKSGRLGKILKIESTFGYQSTFDPSSRIYDPALGGGSLLDVGVYTIALVKMLLDEMPSQIKSSATLSSTGVDESAMWEMTFPSGVIATGESSVVTLLKNEARIVGTSGEIRIPRFWHPELFYLNEQVQSFRHQGMGFQFEAAEVMNSLRSGSVESSGWSHQHLLEVMKLMDDMRTLWSFPNHH